MTRLANFKGRDLGGIDNRLSQAAHDVRDATQPWRKWYTSRQWRKLRDQVLLRDMYMCQKTGILCMGKPPAPDSPVAHHAKPHRGDAAKFFDKDNIICVSKQWHDTIGKAEDRANPEPAGVWY